jgi:aromatase
VLTMHTRTADGSVHKTTSVRIAFPRHRIVYKQLVLPALLNVHAGRWQITSDGEDVVVHSEHTVVIKAEAIASVLGEQATVEDARTFIRQALGRNSTTIMEHAKAYAEGKRAGGPVAP